MHHIGPRVYAPIPFSDLGSARSEMEVTCPLTIEVLQAGSAGLGPWYITTNQQCGRAPQQLSGDPAEESDVIFKNATPGAPRSGLIRGYETEPRRTAGR